MMNYNLDIHRMSYKMKKRMKKMYGKHKAFEIAFGRQMVKTIKKLVEKCS